MKAVGLTFVILCFACGAVAQKETTEETTEETIIRKASFVISAFGCAATGKGTKAENERIFNAGVNVGREVLQFIKTATDAQRKAIGEATPIIWGFAQGPNDDFRLGRLYGAVEDEQMDNEVLNRNLNPKWHETKPADWDARRAELWREKNCQHLASTYVDAQ